jgi:hypothetical protein
MQGAASHVECSQLAHPYMPPTSSVYVLRSVYCFQTHDTLYMIRDLALDILNHEGVWESVIQMIAGLIIEFIATKQSCCCIELW